jgi:hypothetical protein
VNTIEGSTDFSFQTQFLQFVELPATKSTLKNQHLSHLSSENCEINSIKSDWLRAFHQHHQERPQQIPMQFSVSILFSFH